MMGFLIIVRRAVACSLLIFGLANAHNQPVHRSSSSVAVASDSTCCSVSRLEARLTSIERRLNVFQKAIASINDPLLIEYCAIELVSYGYDDSPLHGYVKTSAGSSEEVYAPERIDRNRGVTLFELDPETCKTKNRQRFDTYAAADNGPSARLLETLESATAGTIIVAVTADTPEKGDNMSFQKYVDSFFTRYNMNVTGLLCRDKFSFIMQKGYPQKTVFQRKARFGDTLKMKIQLSGSTVSDVTFERV